MKVMETWEQMEGQLWDYIDGLSGAEEASAIEKLIRENREWREKYAELLELHAMIASAETEAPSLRFTKNVMEEITRHQIAPATRNYINNKIIWGIAFFFIALIGGFVLYAFSQVNWAAGGSNGVFGIDLTQVDYSPAFSNDLVNFFMMTNVVIGLMLLDRYLNEKRKKLHGSAS